MHDKLLNQALSDDTIRRALNPAPRPRPELVEVKDAYDVVASQADAIVRAWNRACPEARQMALEQIDAPRTWPHEDHMTDRWPQMMRKMTAAQYCDLGETAFVREVASGRLPQPTRLGGRDHWYRPALDKALAAIVGDGGEYLPEWEREYWAKGATA